MRKATNGREFLVRWQGFEPADDTWEREEFLNCGDLISEFLKNRKVRKDKYVYFYVVYYFLCHKFVWSTFLFVIEESQHIVTYLKTNYLKSNCIKLYYTEGMDSTNATIV